MKRFISMALALLMAFGVFSTVIAFGAENGPELHRTSLAEMTDDISEFDIVYELPNPFQYYDGTLMEYYEDQVDRKAAWADRRAELSDMVQKYYTGIIPPDPTSVTVAKNGNAYAITVTVGDKSQTVNWTPAIPSAAQQVSSGYSAPFPIILGTSGTVFTNAGIATASPVSFSASTLGLGTVSTYAMLAWNASRLMDAIYYEDEPDHRVISDIDPTGVGFTGHSQGGKDALITGAFDERIAFAVPSQSGFGGTANNRLYYDGKANPWRLHQSAEAWNIGQIGNRGSTLLRDWMNTYAATNRTDGFADGKGYVSGFDVHQYPWGYPVMADDVYSTELLDEIRPNHTNQFKLPVDGASLVALYVGEKRGLLNLGGTDHGWTNAESMAQSTFVARKVAEYLGYNPRNQQMFESIIGHTYAAQNQRETVSFINYLCRGVKGPQSGTGKYYMEQDNRWTDAIELGPNVGYVLSTGTNPVYANANEYSTPYTPSYYAMPWGVPGHYNLKMSEWHFLQGFGAKSHVEAVDAAGNPVNADKVTIYGPDPDDKGGLVLIKEVPLDGLTDIVLTPEETAVYGTYKLVVSGTDLLDGTSYFEVDTKVLTFINGTSHVYRKTVFDPLFIHITNNNYVTSSNASVRMVFGARIDPTNVELTVNGKHKDNGELVNRSGAPYSQNDTLPYWYFPAPGYYTNKAIAVNDVSLTDFQDAQMTGVRFIDFFPDHTFSFNLLKTVPASASPEFTVNKFTAIGVSEDEILLSWQPAGTADGYSVYLDGELVGTTTDTTFPIVSGLSPGTVYDVKVVASLQGVDTDSTLTASVKTDALPLVLNVASSKNIVKKGDYFDLAASFTKVVPSNTAIVTVAYDPGKFAYAGNLEDIEGVTCLNSEFVEGSVKLKLMIDNYNAKDLINLRFQAKEDANLRNEHTSIAANVEYVYKDESGVKTIRELSGSVAFKTVGIPGDTTGKGYVDLIDLSNVIDLFGVKKGDARWNEAEFYDFNNSGNIDIYDIAYVALQIGK